MNSVALMPMRFSSLYTIAQAVLKREVRSQLMFRYFQIHWLAVELGPLHGMPQSMFGVEIGS